MLSKKEVDEATSFKVIERRWLSNDIFVLRFERKGIPFRAGQYLLVGVKGSSEAREYSIYSSTEDECFEILIKKVDVGRVSTALSEVPIGGYLFVQGPFGYFQIEDVNKEKPLLFCSTGTGLSPFHCFATSYPNLKYTLLHGKRNKEEVFESNSFSSYIACTSRDSSGDFQGRLTEYLKEMVLDPSTCCYLCGNCDMIYDVYDILREKGISSFQIFSEVYY